MEIVILAIALIVQSVLFYKEREKLLDRIMARDYVEFRGLQATASDPQILSDEDEKKLYEVGHN